MILSRILDFLAEQRAASLSEIAHALGSPPDAVRSMLQTLQRKGRVHRLQMQEGCGSSCRQCAQGKIEVYGYGVQPPASEVKVELCEGRGR